LNAKNIHPEEIHRQLAEMYGESDMSEGNVSGVVCFMAEGQT
jgi:hypothetical protein